MFNQEMLLMGSKKEQISLLHLVVRNNVALQTNVTLQVVSTGEYLFDRWIERLSIEGYAIEVPVGVTIKISSGATVMNSENITMDKIYTERTFIVLSADPSSLSLYYGDLP